MNWDTLADAATDRGWSRESSGELWIDDEDAAGVHRWSLRSLPGGRVKISNSANFGHVVTLEKAIKWVETVW